MAITTMLVIFALCSILLVVAEMSGVLNNRTTSTTAQRITVDRIGEDFYRAHRLNTDFDPDRYSSVFTAVVEEDVGGVVDAQFGPVDRLYVYNTSRYSSPLLCVEVMGRGDLARLLRWTYNPTAAEEADSGD